jgi:hypothetical protein
MGRQFANDSMTPEPISVSRDKFKNEIPSDRPMHGESTPGKGSWSFGEGHYSDDWNGGYSSYGVSVEDKGQNPSSSVVSVDNGRADRGKDA